MADHGMRRNIMLLTKIFLIACLTAVVCGCASESKTTKPSGRLIKDGIPASPEWEMTAKPPAPSKMPPAFISMPEEVIPLKTKIVTIVVRNSKLGDVLHIIANASGLNLMADKDVPLDMPVTLSLRNVTAEEALKTVVASADCFYTITTNVIKVESIGTKIIELGHPAIINNYSMDIGGNISGAGMSGSIKTGSKIDDKAHDFWGSLESSLNKILDKKDTPAALAAGATGTGTATAAGGDAKPKPVARPDGGHPEQSITVNRLTGTIMVTASRKNIEKIDRYLDNVRRVLSRQVMIEARIIEVQLNDSLKYGIDWSFLENSKILGGVANIGFGALNVGSTTHADATASAAGGSKFQVGLAKGSFQGLLTALKTQGDITTLSNPKINVMNGHPSILTVGTNTSFISKVTTTTTSTAAGNSISFSPETTSVLSGMIIGIVPFISEKGDITLNITPITSDLVDLKDKTFGTAGNQVTITIPTVALREMTTTVKMRDGQMVIIGGLISSKSSSSKEKVPVVGDMPYIGNIFSRTDDKNERTELVLILRPHVVEND